MRVKCLIQGVSYKNHSICVNYRWARVDLKVNLDNVEKGQEYWVETSNNLDGTTFVNNIEAENVKKEENKETN